MSDLSFVSLLFCLAGMPLRAWNLLVGAQWPFTKTSLLALKQYSVIVASLAAVLLMASLTLTRFTATFFAHRHEQWMRKKRFQICLHFIPYVVPVGFYIVGQLAEFFRYSNASGTGIVLPIAFGQNENHVRRSYIFDVVVPMLSAFAPMGFELLVYIAIFIKLFRTGLKRRRVGKTTTTVGGAPLLPTGGQRRVEKQQQKVAKQQHIAHRQQLRTVKVLMAVYCCQFLCVFPNKCPFSAGLKGPLGAKLPTLTAAIELLSFAVYACTPSLFARCSTEMACAYKRLFHALRCCCRVGEAAEAKLMMAKTTAVRVSKAM